MNTGNSGFAQGSAIPFKTQDAILANCLRAAGFTEAPISPLVIYDADILFKAGGGRKDPDGKTIRPSRYAGLSIVEAARRAHKEGERGRVEYHFNHHSDIAHFCEVYKQQCIEIESGEGKEDAASRLLQLIQLGKQESRKNPKDSFPGPEGSSFPDSSILDPREVILRVLCIAFKLRGEFVNRWKRQTPYLVVKDAAESRTEKLPGGGKLEFHPGGKMVPITAPDHTFKNLGLI